MPSTVHGIDRPSIVTVCTGRTNVGVAPTHQFRDRQFSQRGADHAGQQLLRRLAFDAVHQPLALVGHGRSA